MVVSGKDKPEDINVEFTSDINRTLYRYIYTPDSVVVTEECIPIRYDKEFSNVKNVFRDTIPAKAVAIYSSIKSDD